MTGRYAKNTRVSPEKSRAEIERALRRYGAEEFGLFESPDRAQFMFRAQGVTVRFEIQRPHWLHFAKTGQGRQRSIAAAKRLAAQAWRQRWRALAIAVVARLELVELGVTSFAEEFAGQILLPDGKTVAQLARAGELPVRPALPEA